MELNLSQINFAYGHHKVLHNLNFTLHEGEISLLLGPNGAGKSTLNLILAGILYPDEGQIRFCNQVLSTAEPLPYTVGFLGDRELIPADQTVINILELVAKLKGIDKIPEAVEKAMQELELNTVAKRRFGELSLGFRQRVTLAQALLGDPQVLLLDEPGNGLDPRQFKELEENLIRLKKNRIILVSTHRIREAQSLADRVILLNEGKIVAQGQVEELLRDSSQALWNVQIDMDIVAQKSTKSIVLEKQILIDPAESKQVQELLDVVKEYPQALKSINSKEKSLEQLFIEYTTVEEESDES